MFIKMKKLFNQFHRRNIRKKGFDYSASGLYFITICVQNHTCMFGEIIDKKMILNDAGGMIETEWLAMPIRFPGIQMHEYIVMPNHFHSILEIAQMNIPVAPNDAEIEPININVNIGATTRVAPTQIPKTIGDIMDAFKSITTVKYIHGVKTSNWQPFNRKLWQRNYYEHIIRDYDSYQRIKQYISDNPSNWGQK
jgi:putative transposase